MRLPTPSGISEKAIGTWNGSINAAGSIPTAELAVASPDWIAPELRVFQRGEQGRERDAMPGSGCAEANTPARHDGVWPPRRGRRDAMPTSGCDRRGQERKRDAIPGSGCERRAQGPELDAIPGSGCAVRERRATGPPGV
ncbi:hypothetical protein M3G04_16190 [Dietzia cinnamea]|uniref:hypothetical protein n=1 Tax=Dietzia cinnamea TaxID=321318 RepID=UPI00223B8297|nr:hypothetical protein [Dietzia cinnamea]MCT2302416.1 hypothetical protein [Dietzia cinnamea]